MKVEVEQEQPGEEKDYEMECLMRSIKEVEMAKKKKPEMYQKAVDSLKSEAKAISSIADLKVAYSKAKAKEDGMSMEDDE